MLFKRKAILTSSILTALFLSLFLCAAEARADGVVITSGMLEIGGASLSRNAWRGIRFNFGGNNFRASGGVGDGELTQGIRSPCANDPCGPGATVFPNSSTRLDGFGSADFNGTTSSAWWYGLDSSLVFEGMSIVIPDSTASTLTLTTSFTMTGSVFVHSLDDLAHPVLFSTTVSGSGIATLTLQYFSHLGPGGYVLSNVRYDFTPIPEPATLILLGTGLAGLAARYRRRKRNRA